jgi:hypothetical protein
MVARTQENAMPYIIPEAAQKAAWDAYFKQDWEQAMTLAIEKMLQAALPHLLNAQLEETQATAFPLSNGWAATNGLTDRVELPGSLAAPRPCRP